MTLLATLALARPWSDRSYETYNLAVLQVAAHLFDWLTPWWITSLTVWAVLLVVWQAARAGNITVAFLAFPAPADIETGSAGPASIPALEIR